MMAPMHHPAMRHVGPVRAELGTRTIFNILGPLTNPAGVKRQLTGAFSPALIRPMAETLLRARVGKGLAGPRRATARTSCPSPGPRPWPRWKTAPSRIRPPPRGCGPARPPVRGDPRRHPGRERRGLPRLAGRGVRRLPRRRSPEQRRRPCGRRQGPDPPGRCRDGPRQHRQRRRQGQDHCPAPADPRLRPAATARTYHPSQSASNATAAGTACTNRMRRLTPWPRRKARPPARRPERTAPPARPSPARPSHSAQISPAARNPL